MTFMVSRFRKWSMSEFYHGYIEADFARDYLKDDGDFLIRKSKKDNWVISVKFQTEVLHCEPKFENDLYNYGSHEFRHFNDLVYFHYHKEVQLALDPSKQPLLKRPIMCPRKVYKITDIEILSKLGEGNFGEVFMVKISSTQKMAAMKTLKESVDKDVRDSFLEEMNMIASMNHENIVQCLGTVDEAGRTKILLELINKGSLEKLLRGGRLTGRGKIRVLYHVAKGLQYLHRHSIIHRDLAARNILIQKNDDDAITAKVSDFGLSYKDESGGGYKLTNAQKLPLKWLAPECFAKNTWTTASDVWSFGILCWEVFTDGREPYSDQSFPDIPALAKYIKQGGHPVDLRDINPDIKNLMSSCWLLDFDKRPTMDDVVKDFERLCPGLKSPP